MNSYEGIVYDLDGTLVRLDVDWEQARVDTAAKLRPRGVTVDGQDLWSLLERARSEGFEPLVERTLADHERAGARTSDLLPAASSLPLSVPTGVCSLNCEAACHIALEIHGLDGYVDAIVGRDTLDTHKPDPEPLLHTVERLAVSPEATLFVGDTETDATTAERAGVDFRHVDEYLE